jgi:hypothetical protein
MYAASDAAATTRHDTRTAIDQFLRSGDPVEVQNRLTGTWSTGFEVEEVVTDAPENHYVIRRWSDGVILPALFNRETVRACP